MDAIRHRIAGILRLNPYQIGLKAKTGEGVGPSRPRRSDRSPLRGAVGNSRQPHSIALV